MGERSLRGTRELSMNKIIGIILLLLVNNVSFAENVAKSIVYELTEKGGVVLNSTDEDSDDLIERTYADFYVETNQKITTISEELAKKCINILDSKVENSVFSPSFKRYLLKYKDKNYIIVLYTEGDYVAVFKAHDVVPQVWQTLGYGGGSKNAELHKILLSLKSEAK